MGAYKNISGLRFGSVVVIERDGTSKSKQPLYKIRCDCGKEKIAIGASLKSGEIKSCGCRIGIGHGMSKSKEYRVWACMLSRCRDKKIKTFHLYGGRGIKVCNRWLSFQNFILDMGERPTKDHSIDRIDVNGNYEPSNCRWASRETQNNNRRTNVYFTLNGETKTMKQWCFILDVLQPTMRSYLKRHTFEEAYAHYKK